MIHLTNCFPSAEKFGALTTISLPGLPPVRLILDPLVTFGAVPDLPVLTVPFALYVVQVMSTESLLLPVDGRVAARLPSSKPPSASSYEVCPGAVTLSDAPAN